MLGAAIVVTRPECQNILATSLVTTVWVSSSSVSLSRTKKYEFKLLP